MGRLASLSADLGRCLGATAEGQAWMTRRSETTDLTEKRANVRSAERGIIPTKPVVFAGDVRRELVVMNPYATSERCTPKETRDGK
jgi:uncharacterized protein YjlB